jgi:transcription initiation factor TFIIIB Brf1 subunit/transcription initiation factor TFIIB
MEQEEYKRMEISTKNMHIDFQSPKEMVEVVSTKTKLKTRKIPITNGKNFYEQFQYTDNTGNMFPYIVHPRISSELNLEEKVKYHRHTMPLYNVECKEPCPECGSIVDIKDEIHSETLCPTCGYVHHQITP